MAARNVIAVVVAALVVAGGLGQPVDGDAGDVLRVSTEHGVIQGTYLEASEGRILAAFLGVPYARPPIGDLRKADCCKMYWNVF
jgi:hypothetical protein